MQIKADLAILFHTHQSKFLLDLFTYQFCRSCYSVPHSSEQVSSGFIYLPILQILLFCSTLIRASFFWIYLPTNFVFSLPLSSHFPTVESDCFNKHSAFPLLTFCFHTQPCWVVSTCIPCARKPCNSSRCSAIYIILPALDMCSGATFCVKRACNRARVQHPHLDALSAKS